MAPLSPPGRLLRALAGLLAAGVAVGVGQLVAGLTSPASSPVLAIGSLLIDAAPGPVKEFAVRTFGTYDKPILLAGIAAALAVVAIGLGLLAWRHRGWATGGVAALGLVGAAAALSRGGPADAVPSLVAGLAGAATLTALVRLGRPAADTGLPDGGSRRRFLAGLGTAGVVAAVAGAGGVLADRARQAARRVGVLPRPASAARAVPPGAQVPGMTPFTTPIKDFYRVDISLVTPRIPVDGWTLTVDGMVDRPLTLTYADLLELPLIERDITLTCVSNEVGGPYVSSARWLGVPFSEIISRVGVRPGVEQVFSSSLDSGYTASTPYQAVSDGRDAMIAVGMNGEVLPDKNGFPARMIVPGLFGFVSATKWLRRLEFTTYADRTAYWTERKWATDAPILTQSRIDVPTSLSTLPKDKPVIAGVAWAQHRGIEKVEIRIDGGPWEPVRLADDAGIDLWRQWSYVYRGPTGRHTAQVRATDRTGTTQPEQRTKVFPAGAQGWHEIQFVVE